MLDKPIDILVCFPIRKTKKQKESFRNAVQLYVRQFGYDVCIEKGRFGSNNLVIGNPEKAQYLVTAHYDTPAWLPIPNLITPCNFLPYLLYQLFILIFIVGLSLLLKIIFGIWLDEMISVSSYYWIVILFMLIGPANPSNANDNTSGVVTLLEIVRTLPAIHRDKVCFVLFDLEEAGLIGSSSYHKKHKTVIDNQIILNLDCVGEGDHIVMFPTKQMKKDKNKLNLLHKVCGNFGEKSITVRDKGFSVYPSDQKNFPYGVGICALKPSKFGLYLGKIHTRKDTVLDITNVNILRAALTTLICCDAVN